MKNTEGIVMAKVDKILKGIGKCTLGTGYTALRLTYKVLCGPYGGLDKDNKIGNIVKDSRDMFFDEGISDIKEGLDD